MSEFLTSLTFWHWWQAAMGLALLDVFWPRGHLRFAAIGAALTGFALLLYPGLLWNWQCLLFVTVTALGASVAVYCKWRNRAVGRPHSE